MLYATDAPARFSSKWDDPAEWQAYGQRGRAQTRWTWLPRDRSLTGDPVVSLPRDGDGHAYVSGDVGRVSAWCDKLERLGLDPSAISHKAYWGTGRVMPPTVSLSYRSRVRRHHRRRVIEFGTGEMNAHSEPRFLVISRPASYSVRRHWHCSWQCRACTRYGLLPWQCSADSRKRKRAGNGSSDCGATSTVPPDAASTVDFATVSKLMNDAIAAISCQALWWWSAEVA